MYVTVLLICILFTQSCEGLHSDGAGYPDYVELSAKHHALEAIEVSLFFTVHTYIVLHSNNLQVHVLDMSFQQYLNIV